MGVRQSESTTVSDPETTAERLYAIGGGALVIAGMFGRSRLGGAGLMLLGGALVAKARQTRRHNLELAHGCVALEAEPPPGESIEVVATIGLPVGQVFGYWRNFENLPGLIDGLVSVREHDSVQSSWVAKGNVSWEAELLVDRANEVLGWRSLPGAAIRHEGAVYFHALPLDRTEVRLFVQYWPPLGGVGTTVAGWLGVKPEEELARAMAEFKAGVEERGRAIQDRSVR